MSAPRVDYYHVHREVFTPGQLVKAGSWGSVMETQYLLNGSPNDFKLTWRLFQELTFELIRLNEFPDKPSRWKCIFLFDDLLEAKEFMKRDGRDGEHVYHVRLLQPNSSIHRTSMGLYERIPMGRPVMPAMHEQARQYWKGINTIDAEFRPEILTLSDVTVISALEEVGS